MIDRCATCGHPWRFHYRVIEWSDGTKEIVRDEIDVREITDGVTLVCMEFRPTHHVEGVL